MFEYSNDNLDALTNSLSSERLATYFRWAKGDRRRAIVAYEQNIRISESLFGAIRGLEVALRNSMHDVLTDRVGTASWYDQLPGLLPLEQDSLPQAKRRVEQRGKEVLPGRIVAELAFGFWVGLTSKRYDASLWVPHLHRAFPNRRLGRREANAQLERHRILRNRIAHHECILNMRLRAEHNAVLDTIRWICPITSEWVASYSTFEQSLAAFNAWRNRG